MLVSRRDLFDATSYGPLSVLNVDGAAADNAADAVGFGNCRDERGVHTDAFIDHWFGSVIDILSTPDAHEKEAADWFAVFGVEA